VVVVHEFDSNLTSEPRRTAKTMAVCSLVRNLSQMFDKTHSLLLTLSLFGMHSLSYSIHTVYPCGGGNSRMKVCWVIPIVNFMVTPSFHLPS
jgi:hypothetical protein